MELDASRKINAVPDQWPIQVDGCIAHQKVTNDFWIIPEGKQRMMYMMLCLCLSANRIT